MVWRRRAQEHTRQNHRQTQQWRSTLASPILKIKARLAELGGTVLGGTPAEFGKLIAEETEKWGNVTKFANIKPD